MAKSNCDTCVNYVYDKYWEKSKLLALEYDEAKNLSGIRLLDVSDKKERSDIVPLAPVVPLPAKAVALEKPSAVKPIEQTVTFEKPAYTLDDLKEFKNNE